ncbi:MAG: hypothetical protein K2X86_17365 [Cytophagaceae bacterium]|nr:hypothetical protein [Cytophagaceae bacterium]
MKRTIFTLMLSCLISIASVNAQLLSFAKKDSKKSISKKDPHVKFSSYKPEKKSRKEVREERKEIKKIQATSYTPKKSPYYKKQEAKETAYYKKRQERLTASKASRKNRDIKSVQMAKEKSYSREDRARQRDIKENKKHYGTKETRRKNQTVKSDRYILENDSNRGLNKIKNKLRPAI